MMPRVRSPHPLLPRVVLAAALAGAVAQGAAVAAHAATLHDRRALLPAGRAAAHDASGLMPQAPLTVALDGQTLDTATARRRPPTPRAGSPAPSPCPRCCRASSRSGTCSPSRTGPQTPCALHRHAPDGRRLRAVERQPENTARALLGVGLRARRRRKRRARVAALGQPRRERPHERRARRGRRRLRRAHDGTAARVPVRRRTGPVGARVRHAPQVPDAGERPAREVVVHVRSLSL